MFRFIIIFRRTFPSNLIPGHNWVWVDRAELDFCRLKDSKTTQVMRHIFVFSFPIVPTFVTTPFRLPARQAGRQKHENTNLPNNKEKVQVSLYRTKTQVKVNWKLTHPIASSSFHLSICISKFISKQSVAHFLSILKICVLQIDHEIASCTRYTRPLRWWWWY